MLVRVARTQRQPTEQGCRLGRARSAGALQEPTARHDGVRARSARCGGDGSGIVGQEPIAERARSQGQGLSPRSGAGA